MPSACWPPSGQALLARGYCRSGHGMCVVYRSAWNVRILVGNQRRGRARTHRRRARLVCDARSFDLSPTIPGINVEAARANIYNDLPAGEISTSGGSGDERRVVRTRSPMRPGLALRGEAEPERRQAFDLRTDHAGPAVLSTRYPEALGRLPDILRRLEILPQAEVGQLVNLAVLGTGGGDRAAGPGGAAAGACGSPGQRATRAPILRPVHLFREPRPRIPVHRDFSDREGEPLSERPHERVCRRCSPACWCFPALGSLIADRLRARRDRAGGRLGGDRAVVRAGTRRARAASCWRRIGLPWAVRAAVILIAVIAPVSVALGDALSARSWRGRAPAGSRAAAVGPGR